MDKLKTWLHKTGVKLSRKGEHVCHVAYLGAVGMEAHGNYRWAALALLAFVLMNAWLERE